MADILVLRANEFSVQAENVVRSEASFLEFPVPTFGLIMSTTVLRSHAIDAPPPRRGRYVGPLRAISLAGLTLAFLAGGCAKLPSPFAPDTSAARVFTVGYENLADRYIETVIPADMAIKGLSNLSTIDETLSVRIEKGHVGLMFGEETVFIHKAPADNDSYGWGVLTADALAVARNSSDPISAQGAEFLNKIIFGGIFKDLDKYSHYSGPAAASLARASRGGFGGLGITIKTSESTTMILHVHPGTPARRAGLKSKDRITHVNGGSIGGLTQTEVIHALRGPIDKKV